MTRNPTGKSTPLAGRAAGENRVIAAGGGEFADLARQTLTEQGVPILFDERDATLLARAQTGPAAALPHFWLSLRAAELAAHPGFDRLIGLPLVRNMELLEHQVKTAQTVLRRMRGRALLCDEVGLGKTVEAGLILSELLLRGLVRSVLVLTPPSLVEQWRGELSRKFSIEVVTHDDPAFQARGEQAWHEHDRVIASFHTAKRMPHRQAISSRTWDMLIIDEAHHLRNHRTLLWQMASQIDKRFVLLLTATPVQNNLEELFNLVTLLEPGLLSTSRRFQNRFVDRHDKLTPRNLDQLHDLLAEVMVRNRRNQVGLCLPRRWARTEQVTLGAGEQQLYREVAELVRLELRRGAEGHAPGLSRMGLIALQMELGSSAAAAAGTLAKLAGHERLEPALQRRLRELAQAAAALPENRKADRLLALLAELPEQMVVFTQFRATQELLQSRLTAAGIEVALFHGGMGRLEKERQIARFRGGARVLLSTDAGSEGRNLQFCHCLCNFDLPWNPMRIEQRIGRLSRIGQEHDVLVVNLVAAGTIEQVLLRLLEAKLAMFELVIGEIDMVLGSLDEEREFSDVIADLWAGSQGLDEFSRRVDELGDRLLAAKTSYQQQRAQEDRLFGDRFRPED